MPRAILDRKKKIALLAGQIEKGERLLRQLPIGRAQYARWRYENMEVLVKCFGENSPEVSRFNLAPPYFRTIPENAPEETWEQARPGWVRDRLILLREFMQELSKTEPIPNPNVATDRMTSTMQSSVRIFISYSHKDEAFREELLKHLSSLRREGRIATWHDRCIVAGEDWKAKIDDNLDRADLVLLLISADFMHSDYCFDLEMRRAVKRHEEGKTRVVPIIVRSCDWQAAPFGKLQALPRDGKAITVWHDRDEAWLDVIQGVRKVVEIFAQNAHLPNRHSELRV